MEERSAAKTKKGDIKEKEKEMGKEADKSKKDQRENDDEVDKSKKDHSLEDDGGDGTQEATGGAH